MRKIKGIEEKEEKDRLAAEEKLEKEKLMQIAKDKVKGEAATGSGKAKSFPVFNVFHKLNINDVPRRKLDAATKEKGNLADTPCIFETAITEMPTELVEPFKTFYEKFKVSTHYSGSGRGALGIDVHESKIKASVAPMMTLINSSTVFSNLPAAEQAYIRKPSFWGCSSTMLASGPEHAFVASLKVQTMGMRTCLIAPYHLLGTYAKGCGPDTRVWTLQEITDLVTNATEEKFTEIQKSVPFLKATVGPGDALYIPWGYGIWEHTCNRQDCAGLRFGVINAENTPAFNFLSELMLPAEDVAVPANFAAAFIVKEHAALEKSSGTGEGGAAAAGGDAKMIGKRQLVDVKDVKKEKQATKRQRAS